MKKFFKSTLILILTICLIFVFVGCSNDNETKEQIKVLQEQITSLQEQINSLQNNGSGSTDTSSLQSQITALQTQMNTLQTKIDNLPSGSTDNNSLQSQITALQTQAASLQSQIYNLQSGSDSTEKVYNMGETIPYIVNGIHMFDIKVTGYTADIFLLGTSAYIIDFSLTVENTKQNYPNDILNKLAISINLTNKFETFSRFTSINYQTQPTNQQIINDAPQYIYIGLKSENTGTELLKPFAKVALGEPTIIDNTNN